MRWFAVFLFSYPLELLAESSAAGTTAIDPVSSSYLMKLTGGLLVVVAAIFFFAWLMKRLNLSQQSDSGLMRIVAGLSVGTRDRIVLLQVGDEQILVGLSPGRIEKLHQLENPVAIDQASDSMTPFAQKFQKLMNKGSEK